MNCVQLIRILFLGGENFFSFFFFLKKKTRPDGVHSRPDGDVSFYFPITHFFLSFFFLLLSLLILGSIVLPSFFSNFFLSGFVTLCFHSSLQSFQPKV
jgi:hypothetical protein